MANDESRVDIKEPHSQSSRLDTNDGALNLGSGALGNEKCLYMYLRDSRQVLWTIRYRMWGRKDSKLTMRLLS